MQGIFFKSLTSRSCNLLRGFLDDNSMWVMAQSVEWGRRGATSSYYYGPLKPEK